MLGEFLREHGILTILIFLLLVIAFNVGMILQSKRDQRRPSGWHQIARSSQILKDPWKEENDQWQQLSDQVASLNQTEDSDPE